MIVQHVSTDSASWISDRGHELMQRLQEAAAAKARSGLAAARTGMNVLLPKRCMMYGFKTPRLG